MSISIHRDPIRLVMAYDVSWMWDPPSDSIEEGGETDLVAVERRLKRLIAHEVDPNGAFTLVEELRAAAANLPQSKNDL